MTLIIKTSLFSLIALCFTLTQAARFDITNSCSYPVWPAALPGGGRQLNPGESWPLDVPAGTASARIWGRTKCNFDSSGQGSCQSGDCAGALSCTLSGKTPATLAEFTLNGWRNMDSYDISLVDGFNLPMEFSPTSNGCTPSLKCPADKCPDAYLYPSDDTKTHSCPGGTSYKVVFCP